MSPHIFSWSVPCFIDSKLNDNSRGGSCCRNDKHRSVCHSLPVAMVRRVLARFSSRCSCSTWLWFRLSFPHKEYFTAIVYCSASDPIAAAGHLVSGLVAAISWPQRVQRFHSLSTSFVLTLVEQSSSNSISSSRNGKQSYVISRSVGIIIGSGNAASNARLQRLDTYTHTLSWWLTTFCWWYLKVIALWTPRYRPFWSVV